MKRVVKQWEIWDDKEAEKLEKETKRLVPSRFHKYVQVFGKKVSKRIYIRKM